MSKSLIKFAVEIDNEIFKVFSQQVKSRGFLKRRAAEAAIKFWITLSTVNQSQIISGEIKTKKEIKNLKTAAGVGSAGKDLAAAVQNNRV